MKYTLLCAAYLLCQAPGFAQSPNNRTVNAPCVNEGFESMPVGTITAVPGWTLGGGTYAGTSGLCTNYPATLTTNAVIMTVPATNPLLTPSVIPASPFTGTNVLYLSTTTGGSGMFKRLEQTFSVTATNAYFQCAFFGFVPNSPHPGCCDNSYFKLQLLDCSNNAIPMASLQAIPIGSTAASCANNGTVGMATGTVNYAYTTNWLIKNANLAPYIGTCVRFVAEVGLCTPMAHHQSMLLDFQCTDVPYTINGAPVTTTNYVICNANTATLTSAVANSYTWTGPPSIVSNAQTFTTSTSGVYTLATDNLADPALTQTLNLVFAVTPTVTATASNSLICLPPKSVTLTATGTGITSYSWSAGGSTQQSLALTPSITTVYTVTANAATCPKTATVNVKVMNCSGIGEIQLTEPLQIYPNPSRDAFTIHAANEQTLMLRDISGRELKTLHFTKAGDLTITVSDLPDGIYFISDASRSYKIIVLH